METIYVVQGFKPGKRGALQALPAVRASTEEQARGRAERLAETCAGVLAFAQTADAEKGEYEEPVILVRIGAVPDFD